MTETEVADLGYRAILEVLILFFSSRLLKYKNIVDFNVCVDDASLMHV